MRSARSRLDVRRRKPGGLPVSPPAPRRPPPLATFVLGGSRRATLRRKRQFPLDDEQLMAKLESSSAPDVAVSSRCFPFKRPARRASHSVHMLGGCPFCAISCKRLAAVAQSVAFLSSSSKPRPHVGQSHVTSYCRQPLGAGDGSTCSAILARVFIGGIDLITSKRLSIENPAVHSFLCPSAHPLAS
jgi:hypothetical protein